MKRAVLKYGLISGAISAMCMAVTCILVYKNYCNQNKGFDYGMLVGFSGMILAFMFIYFGVASYRDKEGGGMITYGKALAVGLLIMCISCVCYVIAWEIVYHTMFPDFYEKYTAITIEKIQHSGLSAAEIQEKIAKANKDMETYKNPVLIPFITFCEPLPMGIPISFISALIVWLKRKKKS